MDQIIFNERKINQLKDAIANRKQFLLQQYTSISHYVDENKLLAIVRDDYIDMYKQTILQKQKQQEYLIKLKTYLDSINSIIDLSDIEKNNLEKEKNELLISIGQIRNDINSLQDKVNL